MPAAGAGANEAASERSTMLERNSPRADYLLGLPARCADAFAVVWLFVATSAVFPLLMMDPAGALSDESQARLRLLLLPNLAAAPVLVLLRAKAILRLLLGHPVLPLLLLWIWATTLWSVEPEISARRALSLTANTLIACFVVVALPPATIVRRLFTVVAVVLGLSLAFAALLPGLAFMPDLGAFRGVFTHKNVLGLYLVLAAALAIVGTRAGILSPLTSAVVFATVAALIIPTASSTALMLLLFLLALQVPLALAKLPSREATIALTFVGFAAFALAFPLLAGRNRIFMALGRDPSLTGRTEVWAFVRGLIDQRPLLGYGYDAMFEHSDVKEHLFSSVGWSAPNAHNGYLELWLGTGLVGLGLTLAFLVPALVRGWRRLRVNPNSVAAGLASVYLPIYLFRNFSESDLLAQSDITWIIAVIAALSIDRARGGATVGAGGPAPAAYWL